MEKKQLKMIEDVSPIRKGDFPVMCWCVCLLEGMSDGFLHEIVGHYSIFLVLTGLQVILEIWDQFWFVPDLIGTSRYPKNEWQLSWEFTKQKTRKFPEGAAQCDYLQCSNQRMWLGGGNRESFNGHSFEEFSVAKGDILRYSMEQNALHVFGFQDGERDQICLRYNTNHHGKDLDRSIACCWFVCIFMLFQCFKIFDPTFCGVVGEGWGQWQAAVQILQDLKGRSEMSPDVLSYNSLISVCHLAAELHCGHCFLWFNCCFTFRDCVICCFVYFVRGWAIFLYRCVIWMHLVRYFAMFVPSIFGSTFSGKWCWCSVHECSNVKRWIQISMVQKLPFAHGNDGHTMYWNPTGITNKLSMSTLFRWESVTVAVGSGDPTSDALCKIVSQRSLAVESCYQLAFRWGKSHKET